LTAAPVTRTALFTAMVANGIRAAETVMRAVPTVFKSYSPTKELYRTFTVIPAQ